MLGTGRSGTTLVQRLLNSYPDVMIWGEHAGFLSDTSAAYDVLTKSRSMDEFSYNENEKLGSDLSTEVFKNPERWQAWNNWFKKDDVKDLFREHLHAVFNPAQVGEHELWGFKEIRYGQEDHVMEFLIEIFPQAKFIFIVRNGLNTIESQLNTFHKGNSKYLTLKRLIQLPLAMGLARNWREQNLNFKKFSEAHPDNCVLVRYEDIISDPAQMEALFAFVGKPITETQEAILQMKSGRGTGFDKKSNQNERYKRLGLIPIAILGAMLKDASKSLGY